MFLTPKKVLRQNRLVPRRKADAVKANIYHVKPSTM